MKTYLIIGLLLTVPFALHAEEVKFIVNADSAVESLDKATLKKVFLGKSKKLGGDKARVVVYKKGDLQKAFAKAYTSKSSKQFETYWKKLVFSGKAMQPKYAKTEEDAVGFVKANKGAIGFVSEGTAADGVKVLTVTD